MVLIIVSGWAYISNEKSKFTKTLQILTALKPNYQRRLSHTGQTSRQFPFGFKQNQSGIWN